MGLLRRQPATREQPKEPEQPEPVLSYRHLGTLTRFSDGRLAVVAEDIQAFDCNDVFASTAPGDPTIYFEIARREERYDESTGRRVLARSWQVPVIVTREFVFDAYERVFRHIDAYSSGDKEFLRTDPQGGMFGGRPLKAAIVFEPLEPYGGQGVPFVPNPGFERHVIAAADKALAEVRADRTPEFGA